MARPESFELPALWLAARRSIQLSFRGRTAMRIYDYGEIRRAFGLAALLPVTIAPEIHLR